MKVDDRLAVNEFHAAKEMLLVLEGREAPHVPLAWSRSFEEFTERRAKRGGRFGVRERARDGEKVTAVSRNASVEIGLRKVNEHHAARGVRRTAIAVRNRLLRGRALRRPAVKLAKPTVTATCAQEGKKPDGSRADTHGSRFLPARSYRRSELGSYAASPRPPERLPEAGDHPSAKPS